MTVRWANHGDARLDVVVMARNTERFSFLPVVDEDEHFLGLYRTERWFFEDRPRRRSAMTSNRFRKPW